MDRGVGLSPLPPPYLPPRLPPPFWSGARIARAKFSFFPLPPFSPPLSLLPPPLLPPPSPSSPAPSSPSSLPLSSPLPPLISPLPLTLSAPSFIITRIHNRNTLAVSLYPSTRTHHYCIKWHLFVWILLKKSSGGRTPRPPFKHNSFRSYYTHKYWKNQYKNIPATKNTILHASSLQNVMQNMESQVLHPLLNTPPPHFFSFFFFFLLFKKFVAVENKYSVLDLPGNKFSGRARDENK